MTSLGKGLETHFLFELKCQTKIKILDYHPTKPLIAYISLNNILSIWDWDKKACLKCFNINAFESKDLTKTVVIKHIKFFDKDILFSILHTDPLDIDAPFFSGSWLIAVGESKIYFYDYVSEKVEIITPATLDNKIPKIIEIADGRSLAIGCSDGFVKIFDLVSWSFTKTLKGPHHKTINNILAYTPNDGSKYRLAVSSSDGIIASWNVDTETPVLKFNMLKGGKQLTTANNLEDLTSISYNEITTQIVTVTEHHVTVWSSLSGDEIIRYKNIKETYKVNLVEAMFLHYGGLSKDLMIGHGKTSEIFLFDISKGIKSKDTNLECLTIFDFKNLKEYDKNLRIYVAKVHYEKPHLIILGTNQGFFVLSLTKTSTILSFTSSPFHCLYIMPSTVKEFMNEDSTIKKLGSDAIQKCQSCELVDVGSRLPNIPMLSISNESIFCHLLDRSKLDSLTNNSKAVIKTVIGHVDAVPIDEVMIEFELKSSLSGKYFSIRYQKSGLFSVFATTNKNIVFPKESDNIIVLDNLHPVGSVEKIASGCACSLEWHQERDEFAALIPIDKQGKPIEAKEKTETVSKGGFFGGKVTKKVLQIDSAEIAKVLFYIYQIKIDGTKTTLYTKYKDDSLIEPKKLFGGPFYGLINKISESDFNELITGDLESIKRELKGAMGIKMAFYDFNETTNQLVKVSKPMLAAENLYWNLSSTILIATYRTSFFVFKCNLEDNTFKLCQNVLRKVLDGFFWENVFFYFTDTSIRMVIFDLQGEITDMVLAEDNRQPNYLSEIFFEEYFMMNGEFIFDTLYPHPQLKPPGHLKMLGVYDYKLLLVNSREEFTTIELDHPFIRICLNLQFQNGAECLIEAKRLDSTCWGPVFELLEVYGCYKEADTLLSWIKDADLRSSCLLRRSFLRNNKDHLDSIETDQKTSMDLKDGLALEFALFNKSPPNFDLSNTAKIESSNALNSLCKDAVAMKLRKENPGLDLALNIRNNQGFGNVDEYLQKLLTLGN